MRSSRLWGRVREAWRREGREGATHSEDVILGLFFCSGCRLGDFLCRVSADECEFRAQWAVMTVNPMRKERWSGCEGVLCVHRDGSDVRGKVAARGLAGARRGVTSRGVAWRYKAKRLKQSDASKPDGTDKGTTRVIILSKYMNFKYCR